MYCRLMREAVAQVKGQHPERVNETSVEIKINAHVPGSYISDEIQRIEVYKRIAAVDGTRSAKQVREEIVDRYGKMPKTVENLILISMIRHFAMRAGIVSVTRNGRLFSLKYGNESRVDLNRLMNVMERYEKTAQLKAATPPYIVLKTSERALDELLGFLKDIGRCIKAVHQV